MRHDGRAPHQLRPCTIEPGFIGQALGFYQAGAGAGFIGSVVGAVLLLFVVGKLKGSGSA